MEKEGINQGDEFLCFKTATYVVSDDVIFKMGKVYRSYYSGRIEDEGGRKQHGFTYDFWTKYLVKLNENGEIDMSTIKDLPLGDKILIRQVLKKYQQKLK